MRWSNSFFLKYIILLILLFSCTHKNSSQDKLPNWYINPTQNNSNFLYGIGEGFTITEAKNNALMEASSRLSTTISGETNMIRQETNIDASEQFYQKVKGKSEDLRFNNYQISNSSSLNNKIIVEVSIDKSSFISDYVSEINDLYQSITNLDDLSKNKNILIRLKNLNKISEISKKINFYNQILISIGYDSLSNKQKLKIKNLTEESELITQKIEFYIDANIPSDISNIIANELNKKNIKVLKNKPQKFNNNQITIKAQITENIDNIYNNFIVKYTIFLENWSQNKIISSNKIETVGSSPKNKDLARNMAVRKFEDLISKQSILYSLGIEN